MPFRRSAGPLVPCSALDRNAPGHSELPRAALAADLFAAAVLLTGITAVFVELPPLQIGGVRLLSVRSPWRLFMLAGLVLVARHWLVPHPRAFAPLNRLAGCPLPVDEQSLFGTADSAGWRSRVREAALLICFFSAGAVALTWPLARLDSVTDLGDPLFSIWRLAWIGHQLPRNPFALFETNIFYPERLTGTYSDAIIVPGILVSPLFWIGMHPVAVYNLLILISCTLSGVTMFWLVRALTGRRDAAAIAGAIFAFYPYRLEHLPQIELQMTMWMPLVLLALHRSMARGKWRDGLATGLVFALQTLSCLYYGVFLGVYLVPLGAALWLGRHPSSRSLKALTAGAALAAVLIGPVAAKYTESRPMVGERDVGTATVYSAKGNDYFKPHDRSRLYAQWSVGGQAERHLFPTVMPVALSAVALWPPLSVARIGYALSLALAMDGALGFNGGLYPWLYEHLSPFRGVRVPARFGILVGLTLAVLAGYGAKRVLERWPGRHVLLTSVIMGGIALEAVPRLALERVWPEPPTIYSNLERLPDTVLAEFPLASDETGPWFDARYVYFSTFHWLKLVNGYSGFFPPSYVELVSRERDFPSDQAIGYLRSRGVEYIAVHGAFYGPDRYRTIVAELDRKSGVRLVNAVAWQGSESRLYRLQR